MANLQNTKRIMISLPDHLLEEVDGIVAKENSNRSEFIRQAMKLYLIERKKRQIRESMQRGYLEMAKINLSDGFGSFSSGGRCRRHARPTRKRGVELDR